ncbi:hypothetical protein [Rheinheimera salexigens]|uniref:Uncharacterized protein n=1 Tax=Rheinheimera salexigens TaxID=1628148 RepID=A0A1E7Q7G7_9GAMM|nr:hypothetical protein [Rheinheimera salexigens]OEY69988.1 hypothetical protein BI198_10735 [Rheinheimera salexigens]
MSAKLFKVLIVIVCLLISNCLAVFFLITSSQQQQQQQQQQHVSTQDVNTAQQLVSRTIKNLARRDGNIALTINQQQLDAFMSVASYAIPSAEFSGAINPFGVSLHGNILLPIAWFKRSIKLSCLFTPYSSGFAINHCQLGKLYLPSWLANKLFYQLVRFAVTSPADQQLLDLFAKGELKNNSLSFFAKNLGPISLKLQPKLYQPLNLLNTNQAKAADIEFYLLQLQALHKRFPAERRLAFFSHQLLLIATERAEHTSLDSAYHDALWALAVAFANKRFIHYANPNLTTRQIPRMPAMLIHGRRDLSLHFLYSAVLQMLGTTELSQQVGNLKEIMDAGGNGSGFSFADLAADRAGTQFAARINTISPVQLNHFSSEQFETVIMPSIKGLPEGLTEQQVQQQLGGYNGDKFKQLEQEIMSRIDGLSLYRDTNNVQSEGL